MNFFEPSATPETALGQVGILHSLKNAATGESSFVSSAPPIS